MTSHIKQKLEKLLDTDTYDNFIKDLQLAYKIDPNCYQVYDKEISGKGWKRSFFTDDDPLISNTPSTQTLLNNIIEIIAPSAKTYSTHINTVIRYFKSKIYDERHKGYSNVLAKIQITQNENFNNLISSSDDNKKNTDTTFRIKNLKVKYTPYNLIEIIIYEPNN